MRELGEKQCEVRVNKKVNALVELELIHVHSF